MAPPPPPPLPKPKVDTTASQPQPPSIPTRPTTEEPTSEEGQLPEISPEPIPPSENPPLRSDTPPVNPTPKTDPPENTTPDAPSIPKPIKEEKDPLDEDIFGQDELKEEAPTKQPAETPAAAYHTVIQGDTLWNISRRYGTTVDQLRKLNKLTNNNIKKGMRLRVR